MRRAVAVAVLLTSLVAYAEDEQLVVNNDAPLAYRIVEGAAVIDDGTNVYLQPGLYLNDAGAMKLAQKMSALKAENESIKESLENTTPPMPSLTWLLIAVGVGVAAGYGVTRLVSK